MNWYLGVWKKYADFRGRARRAEFWNFVLFHSLAFMALSIVDYAVGTNGILNGLYYLAGLLPSLAVAVRRLHDTNRSGWMLLVGLIPAVGGIMLLIFYFQDSNRDNNDYGPSPKYGGVSSS